jgi:hypothetical protein
VPQGNSSGPLLFNIAALDVYWILDKTDSTTSMFIYADDMVIMARSRTEVKQCFGMLTEWAKMNSLNLNKDETVIMVFREKGKLRNSDSIQLNKKD